MHLVRPHLKFATTAAGADIGGEVSRIGYQHLGAAGLDERRRQRRPAGDVERQALVCGIDAPAVQRDQTGGIDGPDRGVAAQFLASGGQAEGEVDQRREQHQRGRSVHGEVGLQQQVHCEMSAG
jgi:hypothetical protein